MTLFSEVFNKASIYDMLFFNVKAVLIHPTLDELEKNNKPMFERWKYISETKYLIENLGSYLDEAKQSNVDINNRFNELYQSKAPYYPEFCKIVAMTHATLYTENGELKRDIKKIASEDESLIIQTLMSEFTLLSNAAIKSKPEFFPPLCGHNITNYDIPLLIKRFFLYGSGFENNQLPLILKRSLDAKPWESSVIDTVNVWKFNGHEYTSLMLIADYLGLKKTVDLLPHDELSKYYWENIGEKPKETLDFMLLQSATQTNLVIQLMNKLRQF